MENLIQMKNIRKRYYEGKENELEILHGIDLAVPKGQFASIVGESGSGKSTLMNIIGLLDIHSEGDYIFDGQDVRNFNGNELSHLRNQKIGFVFQTYNLIPRTTAIAQVEVPLMYAGVKRHERIGRAKELLELVGMGERMKHRPDELSGGQMQRVAIARAMANDPELILADEPTGALDSRTSHMVMDLFHKLHEEQHKTIVLITHSHELATETERQVTISDGMIVADTDVPDHSSPVLLNGGDIND
ncbi:MAG: ABC transporter ATP-binding protein [Lachnospiraceae bacterium]|nr:ABC transporter ATP-binding protein [Lachnospiraceae bacterium]MEE3461675.1 ABC transporter ATP-binding protein [Lachnospiraceae bacterium]